MAAGCRSPNPEEAEEGPGFDPRASPGSGELRPGHLDLYFVNFYLEQKKRRISFLDFDYCAYGWYLMDVAMLLFDILVLYREPDTERFAGRFLENFLLGYNAQKALDLFWIEQLPHFLKLLEIGVYLMPYRSYKPETADQWVSSFMPGRRARIEEERAYVDLDFNAVAR